MPSLDAMETTDTMMAMYDFGDFGILGNTPSGFTEPI
jgi:hypothetical protein